MDAKLLKAACDKLRGECPEIPCIVGGKEYRTGNVKKQVVCSEHKHAICSYHLANEEVLNHVCNFTVGIGLMWLIGYAKCYGI